MKNIKEIEDNDYLYDVGISTSEWLDIINNDEIFALIDNECKILYNSPKYTLNVKVIAQKMGLKNLQGIIQINKKFAKYVMKTYSNKPYKYYESDNAKGVTIEYWNIPFTGFWQKGNFFYTLRAELVEALKIKYDMQLTKDSYISKFANTFENNNVLVHSEYANKIDTIKQDTEKEIEAGDWLYDVGISTGEWLDIISEEEFKIVEEEFKILYHSPNYTLNAKPISEQLGINYRQFTSIHDKFGKYIVKKLPNKTYKLSDAKTKIAYWNIPLTGFLKKGNFFWTLRPELVEALTIKYDNHFINSQVIYKANKIIKNSNVFEESDYINKIENIKEYTIYDENIKYAYKNKLEHINSSEIKKYFRDPKIAKAAINKALYKCEYNNNHETFISAKTNKNFMEAHHLIPMSFSDEIFNKYNINIDCWENIVSLCPNCHRSIHYAQKPEKIKIIKSLFDTRKNNFLKIGIKITLEELIQSYFK